MLSLIGHKFTNYEIVSLLGEGGMATVYRARQLNIPREVALKVIKTGSSTGLGPLDEFARRFEREVQTIAPLNHPHILKVFDFGRQDDLVYLVMELQSGGSLSELIRNKPLPLDVTLRLLEQIASALDYAHRQGIVHRDLKPQNILLDLEGNAILSDFGLAKILTANTSLTQSGAVVGTPAYMSPEQWQGLPLDSRTDIYSLGAMLYQMLSGKQPFQGETAFSLMHQHIYEQPPSLVTLRADVPDAVNRVLIEAMSKDRELRFQTAGEMAKAFRAALADTDATTQTYVDLIDLAVKAAPPPNSTVRLAPSQTTQTAVPEVQTVTTPAKAKRSPLLGINIVLAILIIAILGAFLISRNNAAGGTSTASNAPEITPVGQVTFSDQTKGNYADSLEMALNHLPLPEEEKKYAAWLADSNHAPLSLGTVNLKADGSGTLSYADPQGRTLLTDYSAMLITLQNGDLTTPGPIMFSGNLPAGSLVHIRHVLSSYPNTPKKTALMVGSLQQATILDEQVTLLSDTVNSGDLAGAKFKLEVIYNLLTGDDKKVAKDLNGDGQIDGNPPSDGFGLFNYLTLAVQHANLAANQPDATAAIKDHAQRLGADIVVATKTLTQMQQVVLLAASQSKIADMQPMVDQIVKLNAAVMDGTVDSTSAATASATGQATPTSGGLIAAYNEAEKMAAIPIAAGGPNLASLLTPVAPGPDAAATNNATAASDIYQ